MIHPFRDGSGRMSRCLQTLVLARERILAQELSSIEEYLGRNTEAYYHILAQVGKGVWNPSSDARPWVQFCLKAHCVQAESVLRRIQESGEVRIEVEKLRHQNRLPERATAALFDAAIGLRVRNSSYRTLLRNWNEEISNQVATTTTMPPTHCVTSEPKLDAPADRSIPPHCSTQQIIETTDPSQHAAAADIRAGARNAQEVDILAIRGLDIIGLNATPNDGQLVALHGTGITARSRVAATHRRAKEIGESHR